MEAAHLLPAADVLRHFSVTAEGGLSPAQVTSARERYGPNGESAGRAGASGAARTAVFVPPPPPPPASRPRSGNPTPALGPPRAGRKQGLRKPLQMLLGHPTKPRGHLRGGRVPGSEAGRQALLPGSLQSQGPVEPFQTSHLQPGPIHCCKP